MDEERVVAMAAQATAHNSGETVVEHWMEKHPDGDRVFLRMSSWPRAKEVEAVTDRFMMTVEYLEDDKPGQLICVTEWSAEVNDNRLQFAKGAMKAMFPDRRIVDDVIQGLLPTDQASVLLSGFINTMVKSSFGPLMHIVGWNDFDPEERPLVGTIDMPDGGTIKITIEAA